MYSFDDFKSHFRLSRHSFQTLIFFPPSLLLTENEAAKATRLVYSRENRLPTKFSSVYRWLPIFPDGYRWYQ